ncbi:type II toxin-antitoxin system RelE/ParE family toxin [Dethiobacter alkaliphilus]|uniref:Addiction module toxin, RelE/StbE family n=1 Tax=Dethiobacter alkaliphilus AHT 1 TaxID=555088 RepID=C0GJT4_DETAL|nr:type II toxin-antitoxin system RelE/ParE family toxin [Dethiobacter alkaliphilus]EEG76392.1 addiction module toxin, RelE/StbE family [Dethiobacter alkaliphilus AHT 1]
MESKYKLKFTSSAESDLNEIYIYISNNLLAPETAQRLMGRIEEDIYKLCDFPFRCELSRNELLREKGYRKLVIDNYIVLYLVDEESKTVIIARAFYGSMDYEKYI